MARGVKTDNHSLGPKLALRRHFLTKYHADGSADVLDCCQGGGVLWSRLRAEFPVRSYWGLDLKPKPGRLKLDSARVLAQPGWAQNVIDIDTYGSPWKHWLALLPNVTRPTTVFLTVGKPILARGGRGISGAELTALGLTFPSLNTPAAFGPALASLSVAPLLNESSKYAIMLIEPLEAISDGNARYFGLRLVPAIHADGGVSPPPSAVKPKRGKRRG